MDHEGGLDGPGAKSAVHRLSNQLAKAGLPQASEGLASVMVRVSSGAHPHYSDGMMIGIQERVHHADDCIRQTSHCTLNCMIVFCGDAIEAYVTPKSPVFLCPDALPLQPWFPINTFRSFKGNRSLYAEAKADTGIGQERSHACLLRTGVQR